RGSQHVVIARRCEISMVKHVKHFRAELHVERLRYLSHVVVLEHREIHIDQSRPDQYVAAEIASNVRAIVCRQRRAELSLGAIAVCCVCRSFWREGEARRIRISAKSVDVTQIIAEIAVDERLQVASWSEAGRLNGLCSL